MARWESDVRAARLWSEQRESELISRGQASDQRQQELAAWATALSGQDQEIRRRLARLAAIEAAQHKHVSAPAAMAEDPHPAAEELDRRQREIQQATAELEQKRQAVQRRADHVDQCRAALEQLRAELGRMHRETLEVRVATEELWVQLSGAAPPAALVRSLGRIRTKLADQYRQANAELAGQKKELEAIRAQLSIEHERLVEHKQQFEQWAADRREECERQASRLVAREQEIHRDETRIRGQSPLSASQEITGR
jgi:hypothetical protein